jgi:hypothetical protein
MVPSFVFIIFADIFFIVVSLFQGGIFRGWFARKEPMVELSAASEKRNHIQV